MVLKLYSGHDFHTKITKGHISTKTVNGVTILVLCTLPDGVLLFEDNWHVY